MTAGIAIRVSEHHVDMITVNTLICSMARQIISDAAKLSVTQYCVLLRLFSSRRPLAMSALAKQLMLSMSSATEAAAELERNGAIVRVEGKADRRFARAQITLRGITLVRLVDEKLSAPIDTALEALSAEQRAVLEDRCLEVVSHFKLEREGDEKLRRNTAILDTALLLHSQVVKAARMFDLAVNDYRVLCQLNLEHRGICVKDLAHQLVMRPNEVTVAVNKLESRKLVKRSRGNLDRRSTLLEITSDGYALTQEAMPVMAEHIFRTHPAKTEVIDAHDSIARIWAQRQRAKRTPI